MFDSGYYLRRLIRYRSYHPIWLWLYMHRLAGPRPDPFRGSTAEGRRRNKKHRSVPLFFCLVACLAPGRKSDFLYLQGTPLGLEGWSGRLCLPWFSLI